MRAKIVLFLLFVFIASLWFFAALDAKVEGKLYRQEWREGK
tara:strand:+ start:14 stop:136 length:123 start_codon:yes stop_codon:yes gene_type:complete